MLLSCCPDCKRFAWRRTAAGALHSHSSGSCVSGVWWRDFTFRALLKILVEERTWHSCASFMFLSLPFLSKFISFLNIKLYSIWINVFYVNILSRKSLCALCVSDLLFLYGLSRICRILKVGFFLYLSSPNCNELICQSFQNISICPI